MAKPDGRLTAMEVFTLKDDWMRKGTMPGEEQFIALCESHERYRSLCQQFIDLYAGRGATGDADALQIELFSLWLRIVGIPPPKV